VAARRPFTGSSGTFVTFEGIEGCGKSTQIERVAAGLRDAGRDVVLTREPGGTERGRALRALLLAPHGTPWTPVAELLLYAADRAQHLVEVIEPALARGAVVLCDRYLDATLAYQGAARGLGVERVLAVHRDPPLDRRPDRTILLDLEPAVALARARARNRADGSESSEGRFEAEDLAFHARVREGYLALAADQPRFRVVPAAGDPSEVEARVRDALRDLLP